MPHDFANDRGREELRQAPALALLAHEVLDDRRAIAEDEGDRPRHAAHPVVGDDEAAEGGKRERRPESRRGQQRAEGVQAQNEHGAEQGGDDSQRGGDRPGNLADGVAAHERLERVGVDLHAGHLTALCERGAEIVVEHLAGWADQNDLVPPVLGRNLAAHDAVVRHPWVGPRSAAEIDEDAVAVG